MHGPISQEEYWAILGELASGLAHDIRGPLTGIAGVLNVIAGDVSPSSTLGEVLVEAQNEAERISRLLAEFLDYARPKALEQVAVDLNPTIETTVALAAERHAVVLAPLGPPLVLHHDAARIQQALLNLLGHSRGEVRLWTERLPKALAIKISDNGAALSPAEVGDVFRPFFRSKNLKPGLAWAVAQRIVELHGGRIVAECPPEGGTMLTVALPIS